MKDRKRRTDDSARDKDDAEGTKAKKKKDKRKEIKRNGSVDKNIGEEDTVRKKQKNGKSLVDGTNGANHFHDDRSDQKQLASSGTVNTISKLSERYQFRTSNVPSGTNVLIVEKLPQKTREDDLRNIPAFSKATRITVSASRAKLHFLSQSDAADALATANAYPERQRVGAFYDHPLVLRAEDKSDVQREAAGFEVFFKYLPYSANETEMRSMFEECGEIVGDIRLMRNPANGQCKGIGWITFSTEDGMNAALAWDGFRYAGRNVSITPAVKTVSGIRGTPQAIGTHTPAMVNEMLQKIVIPNPDGIYIDGTFGRGGHSRAILAHLSPHGRLHAFDMDVEAIKVGRQLELEDDRFTIHHRPFGELSSVMLDLNLKASGVFLDLGISSPQFDEATRGFRPEADGPVDLRFDQDNGTSAHEQLLRMERDKLTSILTRNGETDEIAARRIADSIALNIKLGALPDRTRALANLVSEAKGHTEYQAMHPAKLFFQSLRIHVNQEFEELQRGMHDALEIMEDGGRLGILTWKFNECNIVNEFYREHEAVKEDYPLYTYLKNFHAASMKRLPSPSAIDALTMDEVSRPSNKEIQENSRSRSVLLHVLRKKKALRIYDIEKIIYKLMGWGKPPKANKKPKSRPW